MPPPPHPPCRAGQVHGQVGPSAADVNVSHTPGVSFVRWSPRSPCSSPSCPSQAMIGFLLVRIALLFFLFFFDQGPRTAKIHMYSEKDAERVLRTRAPPSAVIARGAGGAGADRSVGRKGGLAGGAAGAGCGACGRCPLGKSPRARIREPDLDALPTISIAATQPVRTTHSSWPWPEQSLRQSWAHAYAPVLVCPTAPSQLSELSPRTAASRQWHFLPSNERNRRRLRSAPRPRSRPTCCTSAHICLFWCRVLGVDSWTGTRVRVQGGREGGFFGGRDKGFRAPGL